MLYGPFSIKKHVWKKDWKAFKKLECALFVLKLEHLFFWISEKKQKLQELIKVIW